MMTKNLVLLKKRLMQVPSGVGSNLQMAMSIQAQLMKYGFMLDNTAFEALKQADASDIKQYHDDVICYLKEITGSTRSFKPLFGNFPNDVLSLSDSERYYLQMIHYLTNKTFDVTVDLVEPEIFQEIEYKIISYATNERIVNIYTTLAGSGQSLTPVDVETLKWFGTQQEYQLPPVDVPFKENLAVLLELVPTLKVKTVTDVLRVAEVFSGGDGTLPPMPRTKFKRGKLVKYKLTDSQQYRIMDLFENSNLSTSDMNTGSKYGRFIRLGEVLQVGNYQITHPKTFNSFSILRNQVRKGKPAGVPKIRTWYSQVESAFKQSFEAGLTKLAERPGEFMRRIDALVRNNQSKYEMVLKVLANTAPSNKVLFEVYTHFAERNEKIKNRTVFIKGARKPVQLKPLQPLPGNIIDSIQDSILNLIKESFRQLPKMGQTYIDPELKKIPLPTNMRSLQESLVPVIRGQRTPLSIDSPVIRAFVHWYNDGKRACDIDLSAWLVKPSGESTMVGWNGKTNLSNVCLYSGDVTNRAGACAEYIDVDVKKALTLGYKYVLLDARDFKNIGFHTYKECVAGYLGLNQAVSSQTWKPEQINNCVKITSPSIGVLINILDLETNETIWLDIDSSKNTSSSDKVNIINLINRYATEPKISVYDLINWHVEARGGRRVLKDQINSETEMFLYDDYKASYEKILPMLGV